MTERAEVIAELRRARRQRAVASEIDDVLDERAAAAHVTRAGQPKQRWTWRAEGIGLPDARLRALGTASELQLADASRSLDASSSRCDVWELDRGVCDLAQAIAPATSLRPLDALHLATFQIARGKLEGLELLTAVERLRTAAGVPSAFLDP